eukprot:6204478-Pleurochrysis_carterae.AAC.2
MSAKSENFKCAHRSWAVVRRPSFKHSFTSCTRPPCRSEKYAIISCRWKLLYTLTKAVNHSVDDVDTSAILPLRNYPPSHLLRPKVERC